MYDKFENIIHISILTNDFSLLRLFQIYLSPLITTVDCRVRYFKKLKLYCLLYDNIYLMFKSYIY